MADDNKRPDGTQGGPSFGGLVSTIATSVTTGFQKCGLPSVAPVSGPTSTTVAAPELGTTYAVTFLPLTTPTTSTSKHSGSRAGREAKSDVSEYHELGIRDDSKICAEY